MIQRIELLQKEYLLEGSKDYHFVTDRQIMHDLLHSTNLIRQQAIKFENNKTNIWVELGLLFDYFLKNYTQGNEIVFKRMSILKHLRLAKYIYNMIVRLVKK